MNQFQRVIFPLAYLFLSLSAAGYAQDQPEAFDYSSDDGIVTDMCSNRIGEVFLKIRKAPYLVKFVSHSKDTVQTALPIAKPSDSLLLRNSMQITADSKGNLYFIAEGKRYVYRIRKQKTEVFADMGMVTVPKAEGAEVFIPELDGITIDGSDNLYVLDNSKKVIWKINPEGKFLAVVGPGSKKAWPGLSTEFKITWARDLVATPTGEIYFISRIENTNYFNQMNSKGVVTALPLKHSSSQSIDGPLPDASFIAAYKLKADNKGNVYFLDWITAVEGKTFHHFSTARRINQEGSVETLAGCGFEGRPFNLFTGTEKFNGRNILPDIDPERSSTRGRRMIRALSEGKLSLFVPTGEEGYRTIYCPLGGNELLFATQDLSNGPYRKSGISKAQAEAFHTLNFIVVDTNPKVICRNVTVKIQREK